jgi:hypothetical protein
MSDIPLISAESGMDRPGIRGASEFPAASALSEFLEARSNWPGASGI